MNVDPLSDRWFAIIFSHSVACFFILFCWWFPLQWRKFLIWCSPSCSFLLLLPLLLVPNPKYCPDSCQGTYPLGFFSEFYDFRSSNQVFNPFWNERIEAQSHGLTFSYPVSPTSFIEKIVLSSLYDFGSFILS